MIRCLARFAGAVVTAFLLASVLAAGCVRAEDTYTFAVVPQFSQRKLYGIWHPIVEEIARRTGLKLRLVTTLTVSEFERGLSRGRFDFVYANPYHILREKKRQGYIPLVRDRVPLRGILVVPRNSPVRSPADLDGKTLAIPSPNAIGASLLLQADLEQLFHVRMTLLVVKTHSSVYLNVANGLADAGGGVQKTLAEQDEGVRNALRVLYTTRQMPSHPLAAHPRVPKAAREAVRKALLDMAATPEGQALLAKVPMTQPVAASINDYLEMQAWGLDKYWREGAD
jgi:ABC-type phosphate/phosphonate transport system substrate-binding protein